MNRRALVIGGTGMLAPAVRTLIDDGYEVFLPARHRPASGTWIEADWTDPPAFAHAVTQRVGDPVDLLVLWAHRPQRTALARQLRPLIGPSTAVLEVAGSGQYQATGERRDIDGSTLVVLGRITDANGGRWLMHTEISDAVLAARHEPPGTVRIVGTV